jgi:hypothetical protein
MSTFFAATPLPLPLSFAAMKLNTTYKVPPSILLDALKDFEGWLSLDEEGTGAEDEASSLRVKPAQLSPLFDWISGKVELSLPQNGTKRGPTAARRAKNARKKDNRKETRTAVSQLADSAGTDTPDTLSESAETLRPEPRHHFEMVESVLREIHRSGTFEEVKY